MRGQQTYIQIKDIEIHSSRRDKSFKLLQIVGQRHSSQPR